MLRRRLAVVLVVSALLAGCGGAVSDPWADAPGAATDETTSEPTAAANGAEPSADWPPQPGDDPSGPPRSLCDTVDPTTISLNTLGLPYEWQTSCVAATPTLPVHIRIDFLPMAGGAAANPAQAPVIYLIPAGAYGQQANAAGYPLVGERLRALRALLGGRGVLPSGNMPVLPLEISAAANDLAVGATYLDLAHSDGIRFIGRFAGNYGPLLANDLSYVYLGLSPADDLLIAFAHPVTTAHLPASLEALSPTELEEANAAPAVYLSRKAGVLNSLAAGEWSPTLGALDALIGSLEYGGRETGAPPLLYAPQQTGAPLQTHAVVMAPQGTLLYAGPDTCHSVVGLSTAGTALAITGRSADGAWWQTPVLGAPEGWGWFRAANARGFGAADVGTVAGPPRPPDCGRAASLSDSPPADRLAGPPDTGYPPPAAPYPGTGSPPAAYPAPPAPGAMSGGVAGAQPQISAWVDRATILQGECTTLRWSVGGGRQVWLGQAGQAQQGTPVGPDGARLVCPAAAAVYELRVMRQDGLFELRQLPVGVLPGNELAGGRWQLLAFDGDAQLPTGTAPLIEFGYGGYLRGFGGCNSFDGSYAAGGNALSIGVEGRSTAPCGGDAAAQETRLLDALAAARGYAMTNGQLLLFGPDGGLSLRFGR